MRDLGHSSQFLNLLQMAWRRCDDPSCTTRSRNFSEPLTVKELFDLLAYLDGEEAMMWRSQVNDQWLARKAPSFAGSGMAISGV